MMDSGVLLVFTVDNAGTRGSYPVKSATQKAREYFECRVVGLNRYYAARQANVNVELVARIWRNEDISTQDIAQIEGESGFYKIQQVQHVLDDDQMPVTDLSLERTIEKYDAQRS